MVHTRSFFAIFVLLVITWFNSVSFGQGQQDAYILLIDTSSSMKETPKSWKDTKIAEVKRQLAEFCTALPRDTQIIIYTFSSKPPKQGPRVVVRGKDEQVTLRNYFDELKATGRETHAWSSLDIVLDEAKDLIKQNPQTTVHLYMYTDGDDNEKPQRNLDTILDQYDDLLKDQIRMSYVTLGFTLSERLKNALKDHNISTVDAMDWEDLVPLNAAFGWAPAMITTQVPVQFFDKTNVRIEAYDWRFGDGATSTAQAPSHQYTRPGKYTVSLTVKNITGRTSTKQETLEVVTPPRPEPEFVVGSTDIHINQDVVLADLTKQPVDHVTWDFGDGSTKQRVDYAAGDTQAKRAVQHRFRQAGQFVVTLTATGPGGTGTAKQTLQVKGDQPPVAKMVLGSADVQINEQATFIDVSTGITAQATWNWGDSSKPLTIQYDKNNETTRRTVTHTYTQAGSYVVTLTVTGPGGTRSTKQTQTVKGHQAPTAKIVLGTSQPHASEPVTLLDASEGEVTQATWHFGDASQPVSVKYGDQAASTNRTITHTYDKAGTFDVTLEVQGPGGKSTDHLEALLVSPSERLPKALFEVNQSKGRGELTVRFTNTSSGPITQYVWDFGDGSDKITHNTKQDVEHTYAPGTFTPTLTAVGADGLAPDIYRAPSPIVVKQPWPAWIKHLFWGIPLLIVVLVAIMLSLRQLQWRGQLRQIAELSGTLYYRRASETTASLQLVDTTHPNDDPTRWEFLIRDQSGDGNTVGYVGELHKAVTVVQRPMTEITYTLELKRDGLPVGSASIEDGQRVKLGPFSFEYRVS